MQRGLKFEQIPLTKLELARDLAQLYRQGGIRDV